MTWIAELKVTWLLASGERRPGRIAIGPGGGRADRQRRSRRLATGSGVATIDRSVGPIYLGEADGNDIGCAISRNLLGTQWYASDFRVPHGTSPSVGTVHYGPFAMREQARAQVDPVAIEYLDSQGTNGLSLWLVLPI